MTAINVPSGRPRLKRFVALAALAVGAFHVGFLFPAWSWLVLVWLGALFALRRLPCGRWAFYTGLAIGAGMYAPQLAFFWRIFGPAAVALWLVLAFWLGLFLLTLHGVDRYWGSGWATGLAPVLWLGIEFFRSELYYLRFAWFTAGSVPPTAVTGPLLPWLGVYGLGAMMMALSALGAGAIKTGRSGGWRHRPAAVLTALGVVLVAAAAGLAHRFTIHEPVSERAASGQPGDTGSVAASPHQLPVSVPVAGVQLENPKVAQVLEALSAAQAQAPDTPLWVLSEYTFDGPVPDEVRAWCREQQRWLVAGGRDPLEGGGFRNTAFVVSTNGEVVFKQVKAVPIPFFQDGRPATEQRVWESPWGRLGICVCYDLNYARVVDRLIRQGAHALLVPTMDVESWGVHEHQLNARLAPVRAAEYGVPILRVASSGMSQLIRSDGSVVARGSIPGQGEVIAGWLSWPAHRAPGIPLDRVAGPLATVATATILLGVAWTRRRRAAVGPPAFTRLTPPRPTADSPECSAPSSTCC